MVQHNSGIDDKLHWYKDAVIYEVHIKAFRDSNRDGIGDFQGLMEQLDYLQELGVTAIWLLPFYPSPLKDDGYDIADYYSINPRYGTLEEFRELLKEAHKRNLKVITELVINHTSDQHPWFQRARKAPRGSVERNFYVWTDDPHQYKDVRIIFQDFESSNWTWDPVAQQYYWHRFFHHQPDLNYDHPQVQEEIFRIIDYWCAMGVDGFRLDAVPYLYEREGTNGENLPETHAFLKRLRKHIDEKYPGVAFLAEANMWPEDSASYFGDGDECHMNYHFPVMPRMFMSLQLEDRYPITDIFDQTPPIPSTCQWAIFLRNHDELTLEMVTDEERDFMYKVYAKDPKARINLGIRHRLAPLMENNRSRIELMNSLLFSLPGTPVIYYGDEIGMGDNFYLGDRDGVRTPMQWSPDRNAGFSEANPQQLYLPVILDPEYHYEAVNVEMQRRNTSSLFWFMKRMINMRKNHKAFGRGDMKFIQVENPKILAFTRSYEDETILIIANLSKYAQPAEVDLRAFRGFIPVELFSKNPFPVIKDEGPYFFTLSPHSFQWYVLQKTGVQKNELHTLPSLMLNQWEDVISGSTRVMLENEILPEFLLKRRWFKGRQRKLYSINIQQVQSIPLPSRPAFLLLVEVSYESGLPENYQLAIGFSSGQESQQLASTYPEAIIAQAKLNGKEGLLCDAFYLPKLHQYLIHLPSEKPAAGADGMRVSVKNEVTGYLTEKSELITRMHAGDENNTSINIDNRFFLKMYRKIDRGMNPDVELSRYLSEEAGFEHIPQFLGLVQWQKDKEPVTLGMIQALIENHGDGHSYMIERLKNFIERILARDRNLLHPRDKRGSITEPVSFEELPSELQVLLGNRAAEQARLIGLRTAEMHLKLSQGPGIDFRPEEYSLHYQRSLFSSMQSLVRETYQSIEKKLASLPENLRKEAMMLASMKEVLLQNLRRIYFKKLDIVKIRIHGTYNLHKLLMTGKDVVIHDFGGNTTRSYSERRIRRSPVRDLAEMISSFYYTAYEGFFSNDHIAREENNNLMAFADQWAHYMSGFFMKAYIDLVKDSSLIPRQKDEFRIVLDTFLLEKSLAHLNFELNNRPEWSVVPLHLINTVLQINQEKLEPAYE
ncbi:MAG: maltose alpha-D-glucosyltransferase [Flavisolibacter sp.]